jgi:3-methyladenine DNA glycosylase AlkC
VPTADELLGAGVVGELAGCLRRADRRRRWARVGTSSDGFAEQGLAGRVRTVQAALLMDLPAEYGDAARVVRRALEDERFDGWMIWPVGEAVAVRALESGRSGDFGDGLALLAELTGRMSSEFALRRFLAADVERSLAAALAWTGSEDEHVRRLASEGTRPRLPWGRRVAALTERPAATRPILDALHRDHSEYVRRSVANHLNDVSRIDAALAVETAGRWSANGDADTPRLVRRALRTLVKDGDAGALALLGFASPDAIRVAGPILATTRVSIGEALRFEAEIANEGPEPAKVAVDYVVHHRKANGSLSAKVFKLTTRELDPGDSVPVARSHSFRPITTRRYYPGDHLLELQVNGRRFGGARFELVELP